MVFDRSTLSLFKMATNSNYGSTNQLIDNEVRDIRSLRANIDTEITTINVLVPVTLECRVFNHNLCRTPNTFHNLATNLKDIRATCIPNRRNRGLFVPSFRLFDRPCFRNGTLGTEPSINAKEGRQHSKLYICVYVLSYVRVLSARSAEGRGTSPFGGTFFTWFLAKRGFVSGRLAHRSRHSSENWMN